MNAAHSKVRIELSIPGDAGHVGHRISEALNHLVAAGFRVEARMFTPGTFFKDVDVPTYMLADTEDPVDSSTVDDTVRGGMTGHPIGIVNVVSGVDTPALDAVAAETCGRPACMHPRSAHRERKEGEPEPVAGRGPRKTADIPVLCATPIAPGVPCRCPGFTPITTGRTRTMNKPGPY